MSNNSRVMTRTPIFFVLATLLASRCDGFAPVQRPNTFGQPTRFVTQQQPRSPSPLLAGAQPPQNDDTTDGRTECGFTNHAFLLNCRSLIFFACLLVCLLVCLGLDENTDGRTECGLTNHICVLKCRFSDPNLSLCRSVASHDCNC